MKFEKRAEKANLLISLLDELLWKPLSGEYGIMCVPYGYETHIPKEAMNFLQTIYTPTAKHVRFAPDYVLLHTQYERFEVPVEKSVLLLEYKATTTPKYTLRESQFDYGQVEADALENYLNLSKAGISVVLLIYCSYHSRPFLMEYCTNLSIGQRQEVKRTRTGSGTDYYNLDLKALRTVADFLSEEYYVDRTFTESLLKEIMRKILNQKEYELLWTRHDDKSQYNKGYETGFNWNL